MFFGVQIAILRMFLLSIMSLLIQVRSKFFFMTATALCVRPKLISDASMYVCMFVRPKLISDASMYVCISVLPKLISDASVYVCMSMWIVRAVPCVLLILRVCVLFVMRSIFMYVCVYLCFTGIMRPNWYGNCVATYGLKSVLFANLVCKVLVELGLIHYFNIRRPLSSLLYLLLR